MNIQIQESPSDSRIQDSDPSPGRITFGPRGAGRISTLARLVRCQVGVVVVPGWPKYSIILSGWDRDP